MKISIVLEALTADFVTDMNRAQKSLDKSIREMEKTAKQVGVAIGGAMAAAVAGLGALGIQAINAADKLNDASQRTGVMVEALSKLKYAAEQSGTSFAAVERGLQKLSKEADSGGKNLARIGVSATDAAGRMRPMDEILLDVSDRFSGMANDTEKAAAAQAIFGKAGAELIPLLSEGRDGIEALGKEAERLGVVFTDKTAKAAGDFNDNLDKLKSASLGLGNELAQALLPALVDITNSAVEYGQQLLQGAKESGALQDAAEAMAEGLKVSILALALVKNALDAFIGTVKGAVKIVGAAFGAIGSIIGVAAESIRDGLAAAFNLDAEGVKKALTGVGKAIDNIMNDAANQIAASSGQIVGAWDSAISDTTDAIDAVFGSYETGADQAQKLAQATAEAAEGTNRLGASAEQTAEKQKRLEEAGKLAAEAQKKLAEELRNAAEGAFQASGELNSILDQQAATLGGPGVAAALDYRDVLLKIYELEVAMLAIGPQTEETTRRLAQARSQAAAIYSKEIDDQAQAERDRIAQAAAQADEYGRIWQSAYEQQSYLFADALTGQIETFDDFADSLKQIWLRALSDMIAAQLRSGLGQFGVGSIGGGAGGATGAAGGVGGFNPAGLLGAAGGLIGGGLGTGLMASASIFSGAGLLGGITGSIGAGVASIAGGAFMQGVGLLLGPVGLIVGAVAALTQIFGEDQETILRVRSQQFSGDRQARGVAESQLGSIFVRGESLGDGAAVEIAGRIKDFDNLIAGLLNDDQLAAVRDRLSAVNDTFRDGAATVGEALDARFGAILGELSADVVAFVGTAGELEDRVGRLAEALQIESLVEFGTLGDTFGEVAGLIEEYRQGTEEIGATYTRLIAGAELFEAALGIAGLAFDGTRQELIAFAADITEAAGGLERAQSLWSAYFETFYTADERAAYALQQARANAAAQASDIGLDLAAFDTEGGDAQFRELFESMLPTLSAEAVVEWLEFADALGIIIGMSGEAAEVVEEFGETLADIMAEVGSQLADFAGPETFAERIATINTETEALIQRATALGATEQQLASIRELGAARLSGILGEQVALLAEYDSIVQGVRNELADAGMTDFQREIVDIQRSLNDTVAAMNAAAVAAGMQGAAELDLAAAHELAAMRVAEAIGRLGDQGRDLVTQLYGTQLDRLNEQIAAIESGVSGAASSWASGMGAVSEAVDSAVNAQLGAQERIRDWLDNLLIGDLGGLRPRDALVEAQALFDETLAAALGGDAEAMAALPGLADQLLRLGQQVYASGGDYFGLRDTIRDALEQVSGLQFTGGGGGNPEIGAAAAQGGYRTQDFVWGAGGGDLASLQAQRDELMAQQAAVERQALLADLMGVIRELVVATGDPLEDIAGQLGVSMTALVADLGINLESLTVASASSLADIAQAMGVELTELAGSVGVDLGSLADRQSLLNDALEAEISGLPPEQAAELAPMLAAIETAAELGDNAGVIQGIADMEAAIADMSPALRDALAPFFAGIAAASPATQLAALGVIADNTSATVSGLGAVADAIALLADSLSGLGEGLGLGDPVGPIDLGGGGTGPLPPGYATGTGYVPADGLAMLHRGEAIFPAQVADFFRREGIPMPQSNNGALVEELRQLRRENADDTRRLESRLERLETATRDSGRVQAAATDRLVDVAKSGSGGRSMLRGL